MRYFKAFLMSLGMFSVFPAPENSWDEDVSCLVIPCLPLVGAVIGAVWYALSLLLRLTAPPLMLHASVMTLIPFFLSGFLHIDGFMDTADAVLSRRGLEERRRILKDPAVGAFAVIALVCLMMLQFASVYSAVSGGGAITVLAIIPVASRCASGAALLGLRQIYETGYMATFKADAKPRHTAFIYFIAAAAAVSAFFLGGIAGVMTVAAVFAASGTATAWTYRQMDGLNGDLCGCAITVGELGGLLCLAVL